MELTQYICFEIGRGCNLGHLHAKCPNQHPERYSVLPHSHAFTDEQIIDTAAAMYQVHGFRGRVGWHYYNEPLLAATRMWRLMNAIDVRTKGEANYTLWTNGTLIPYDCTQFDRFADIHVTDYDIPDNPVRNVKSLLRAHPRARIGRVELDDRLNAIGDDISYAPCRRMFLEVIVDYYGNVRLCCHDWRGLGSIGNLHVDSLNLLVSRWKAIRRLLSGEKMAEHAPDVCLRCRMKDTRIPRLVPKIAREAERCHA